MFDPRSRYRDTADATLATPDGEVVTYRLWRILPARGDLRPAGKVAVSTHERLDQVAARVFGDATQFWQLCDANDVLDPQHLLEDADDGLIAVAEPSFRTTR